VERFWWIGLIAFICWLLGVRSDQLGIIITVVMCFFPAVALLNYFSRKLQERRRKAQQAFDVDEFRRELLSSDGFDREVYDRDLKPVVDRLEAQYGRLVPTSELASLQHLVVRSSIGVERSSGIWPCTELCVAGRAPADRIHARFAASLHERWAKGIFIVGYRIEGDELHARAMH
jgi:hypothetical protein